MKQETLGEMSGEERLEWKHFSCVIMMFDQTQAFLGEDIDPKIKQ